MNAVLSKLCALTCSQDKTGANVYVLITMCIGYIWLLLKSIRGWSTKLQELTEHHLLANEGNHPLLNLR